MDGRFLTPEEIAELEKQPKSRFLGTDEEMALLTEQWQNLNPQSRQAITNRYQPRRDMPMGEVPPQQQTQPYHPFKDPLMGQQENSLLRAVAAQNIDVATGLRDSRLRLGTNFAANKEYAAEFLRENGLEAKVDPDVGVVFMNDDTGLWTSIDEFGFTGNDIVDSANELTLLGPELVGGVAGAISKVLPGAASIGLGSLGAGAGEYARHGIAQRLGVPEPTNIHQRARESSFMAAAWGTLGEVTVGIGQVIRSLVNPKLGAYDPDYIRYILNTDLAKTRKALEDDINKTLEQAGRSERFHMTPGQLSDELHQLSDEGSALSSVWGEALQARHVQNKNALEAYLDVMSPLPEDVATRTVSQAALDNAATSGKVLDALVGKNERDVRLMLQNIEEAEKSGRLFIAGNFDYMEPDAIGQAAIDQLNLARGVMKRYEDFRWGQARQAYGYDAQTATSKYKLPWNKELADLVERYNAEAETALFTSDRAGKNKLVGRLKANEPVYMVAPDGEVIDLYRVGQDIDLDAAVRALQHLNRLERQAYHNKMATDAAGGDVVRMKQVLKRMIEGRMDDLARGGDTNAGMAIHYLRDSWEISRKRAELFDRGIVGQILNLEAPSHTVKNPAAALSFLKSSGREELRTVYDIVSGYSVRGLSNFRKLIYADYRRFVAEDGVPNLARHKKWMANHGQLIDEFFPQNASRIKGEFGSFGEEIAKQQTELLKLEEKINRLTGNKLVKVETLADGTKQAVPTIDAEDLVIAIRDGQLTAGQVRSVINTLQAEGYGNLVKEMEQRVAESVRNKILSGASPTISVTKLDGILANAEELTPLLGQQYFRNLEKLKAAVIQSRRTTASASTGNWWLNLIEAWTRPVMRPLSRPGLVRTAVRTTRAAAVQREMAEIVADPQKLALFMELQKSRPGTRYFANIVAQLGITNYNDLLEVPYEPTPEYREERLRQRTEQAYYEGN